MGVVEQHSDNTVFSAPCEQELLRAFMAMSQVADALALCQDVPGLVPTVLGIVARTFGVHTAGFFEHPRDDQVRLLYWYDRGRVYNPQELVASRILGRGQVPALLAQGFRTSKEYLNGHHPQERTRALTIDHTVGTCEPTFDAWTRLHGWEMELNVPCLCRGRALWALVLYRPAGSSYSPGEVALAEALAQQMAVAVQMDQLAEQARDRAVSQERHRMIVDVHDTLSQCLTGISMQARAAGGLVESCPQLAEAGLHRIQKLAHEGLREVRRSLQSSQEETGETRDLISALQRMLDDSTVGTSVHGSLRIRGRQRPLDGGLTRQLTKIAGEALSNALRHGTPKQVLIRVEFMASSLRLAVEDDGCGFDTTLQPFGIGLPGMNRRAQRLGAALHIESSPSGTQILLTTPLNCQGGSRVSA